MRFVRPEDERIASDNFGGSIFMANIPLARNNQVKLRLRRVCMVRKISFSRRHPIPFQIKRLTLRQVERSGLAPQCFRNSFEGDRVLSARRVPCFFFDFVNIYLSHESRFTAESAEFAE